MRCRWSRRDENVFLRDIERLLKKQLPREVVPGFEAGKPGTIVEEEAPRGRPKRAAAAPRTAQRSTRTVRSSHGKPQHGRPGERTHAQVVAPRQASDRLNRQSGGPRSARAAAHELGRARFAWHGSRSSALTGTRSFGRTR